jgi:nucleoid DNA-binding protein
MTISELIDQVAASDSKLTKAQAKAIVDAVFGAI